MLLTTEIFAIPEKALSRKFGQWGYFVAQNAWLFIITTGLLGCCSSIGFFWLQTEKDIDVFDIYFPRNGRITQGLKSMRADFPDTSDMNYFPWQDNGEYLTLSIIIWDPKVGSKDIISNENVKTDIGKICEWVQSYSIRDQKLNKTLTYKDVCAIDGLSQLDESGESQCLLPEFCQVTDWNTEKGVLKFYSESILQMVNEPKYTKKGEFDDVVMTQSGISARLIFFLKKANESQLAGSYSWVRRCFNDLHVMVKKLNSANYALYSLRIQLDEWGSVFERDSKLFALAVIFLVGFSVIASSSLDCLTSRSLLALAAILSTILAIVTGIAVLSIAGIPLIQVAFLTPFIILGVGIDGAFVMMFTWAKTDKLGLKPEERVSATLDHCFVSIFISNLTSLLAFTVGSFTPYMAVNISCYYLASMVVSLTFFELTFFTACLSVHTKRVHCTSSKLDKAPSNSSLFNVVGPGPCPPPACNTPHSVSPEIAEEIASTKLGASDPNKTPSAGSRRNSNPLEIDDSWALNLAERYLIKYMPKIILHDVSRVIILIGVGVLLAIATRSTIKMPEYINEVEYQPDSSKVIEYYHTEERLFRKPTVVAFVLNEKINYSNPENRENLNQIVDDLIKTGFFLNFTDLVWFYDDIREDNLINEKNGNEIEFTPTDIKAWLKETKAKVKRNIFKNDIILDKNGKHIEKSRFFLLTIEISQYDSMTIKSFFETIYPVIDNCPFKLYTTSIHLSRWERNITMKQSIWRSIGIGLGCCMLVMSLLLGDFRVIFLSVLVTACSMVSVLGYMGVWGITYNMSTYIEVLLLIGLCVDYASHSGHSYKRSRGLTSKGRAEASLEAMGVPLINAAASSILGIVMLAFSSSYGMRTLFVTALFLFSFSFFYGVCVLPVLLSFFGPVNKDQFSAETSRMASLGIRENEENATAIEKGQCQKSQSLGNNLDTEKLEKSRSVLRLSADGDEQILDAKSTNISVNESSVL
ncbi:patched domain-containing protein 3-like isoform X3 [Convolutriloba macropyga]|uniref:patched domain-containing protein 3-like isoform X3 n=1 Tax=Convolutriloba macropyga TaxID=536237 RepID=UPI003F51E23B